MAKPEHMCYNSVIKSKGNDLMTNRIDGRPVTCECGKLVAVERNGKIYVRCKRCGRQVEVAREPRTQEVKSH